ncbi:MAG: ABC transporter substrate-binding protein, partial [Chloroflexota bacterium]|nr:ABC transporter substrate-binding protein [Chloroflexota bacterium]
MVHEKMLRRDFIRLLVGGAGVLSAGALLQACGGAATVSTSGAPASPAASSAAASKPAPKPASASASASMPASASAPAGASAKAGGAIGSGGPPEKASITVGLPSVGGSHTFLPVYLASEQTGKAEGLTIKVIGFQGNGPVSQALASGAIDLSLSGVNGLVSAIAAKQPIVGFYAGFWQAFFNWISIPSVKTWEDMKGKIMAVTTPGSLTDTLTRYVVEKHGIDPKDIN